MRAGDDAAAMPTYTPVPNTVVKNAARTHRTHCIVGVAAGQPEAARVREDGRVEPRSG